jgi:hypothetical protein
VPAYTHRIDRIELFTLAPVRAKVHTIDHYIIPPSPAMSITDGRGKGFQ